MATITTSHPLLGNTERIGVKFKDGKGKTSDPAKIAFFRRQASVYTVHESKQRAPQGDDKGEKPQEGGEAGQGQDDSKGGDSQKSES